jgi:hypothetical protein
MFLQNYFPDTILGIRFNPLELKIGRFWGKRQNGKNPPHCAGGPQLSKMMMMSGIQWLLKAQCM